MTRDEIDRVKGFLQSYWTGVYTQVLDYGSDLYWKYQEALMSVDRHRQSWQSIGLPFGFAEVAHLWYGQTIDKAVPGPKQIMHELRKKAKEGGHDPAV